MIEAGTGRVFNIGGTIASLFAADPKVVEVRPVSHSSVFIFGLSIGRSTVTALDEAGNALAQESSIVVRPSPTVPVRPPPRCTAGGAGCQGAVLRHPGRHDGERAGADPGRPPSRWRGTARSYVGDSQNVDNRTTINSSVQGTLRVRIAEIARNITRQLGINWTALANFGFSESPPPLSMDLPPTGNPPNTIGFTFKAHSINAVLDLLAQDQLITMLAEPN